MYICVCGFVSSGKLGVFLCAEALASHGSLLKVHLQERVKDRTGSKTLKLFSFVPGLPPLDT